MGLESERWVLAHRESERRTESKRLERDEGSFMEGVTDFLNIRLRNPNIKQHRIIVLHFLERLLSVKCILYNVSFV